MTFEQPRPGIHFAPERNWMNDPNGLVFHDGLYHLYFQYNPEGTFHGNMSWGHATSPDLIDWTEHPVALRHDDDGEIFSGSIVVDHEDTAGFGADGAVALVAIYTAARPNWSGQSQALAYSLDGGYRWTKYAGNPVLDRGTTDFRDPKVFRFEGQGQTYWVMVAVEAQDRQVLFYRSDDLKAWTFLSAYGPAGAVDGVWECPDLFPLAVDGDESDTRWVLLISLNPGGVAGGSATQYVVGRFDGVTFTPDVAPLGIQPEPLTRGQLERIDWLDWGRDCYAGVTFSGLPPEDRLLIAWASNWDYAHHLPDAPWRGEMTLPRRLSLTAIGSKVVLRQEPIVGGGRDERVLRDLAGQEVPLEYPLPDALRIDIRLRTTGDGAFALRLRHDGSGDGGVVFGYDSATGRMALDRTAGVSVAEFASIESAPLKRAADVVAFTMFLDTSLIEVFGDEGATTLTDRIAAPLSHRSASVSASGGVLVEELRFSRLGGDLSV